MEEPGTPTGPTRSGAAVAYNDVDVLEVQPTPWLAATADRLVTAGWLAARSIVAARPRWLAVLDTGP